MTFGCEQKFKGQYCTTGLDRPVWAAINGGDEPNFNKILYYLRIYACA